MRRLRPRCLLLLALATSAPAIAADDCHVLESGLPGSWARSGDAGFFEEMAFSVNGQARRFDSWLHHRPDVTGAAWSLEGCRLVIRTRLDGLPPLAYTATLDKGQLRLRDVDGGIAIYTRFGDAP